MANDTNISSNKQTFSLTLAGLASTDGVDIDAVLQAAAQHAPPQSDAQNHADFAQDLRLARTYAQEHQAAAQTIEDMVASGISRNIAIEEVSAAVPVYREVENALMATETSYELQTNRMLDPLIAASGLGSNMAYAYGNGGEAAFGSLLSNTTMSIDIIEEMRPIPSPQVAVEQPVETVDRSPEVVVETEQPISTAPETVSDAINENEMDSTRDSAPIVPVTEEEWREAEGVEQIALEQQEANRLAANTQQIKELIEEKMAQDPTITPAQATASVVLNRVDSFKNVLHIPQDEFTHIAADIQANKEQELGIQRAGDSITAAQIIAMQPSSELSLSSLDLMTSTTEARLATEKGQADAAAILFNASADQELLTRIAENEGLVVLNDRNGNGIKIESNGDNAINKEDITIHVTDASLKNSVDNSLIGVAQLDSLVLAAERLGLSEIHLNVGLNGIADPSNAELAAFAAQLREDPKALTPLEIETNKIQDITLEMMAQGGQAPNQLWGNAVGAYHRNNDDPNKLSVEETMGIVQATFRDELQQKAVDSGVEGPENPMEAALKGVTLEGFNGDTVVFAEVDDISLATDQGRADQVALNAERNSGLV